MFIRSKLYNTWTDVKRRAKRDNVGISDRWKKNYKEFETWAIENDYVEGKVALIRVDKSKGYGPENCKFVKKYQHVVKHGSHKSKLYSSWTAIKQRCSNPKNSQYENYGKKGISIYSEWEEFSNFQTWALLNGYEEGLMLDRKDFNGDFEPKNCHFVLRKDHSSFKNSPIINKKGKENPAYKHGMTDSRLYNIWDSMKQRCTNPKRQDYKNYGGKGIKVCNEWLDFTNFYEWAMLSGYESTLTIERIDYTQDYNPNNCKWIPIKDQARNKSQNRLVTIKGETKILAEWAEIAGISPKAFRYRLEANWEEDDLLLPVGVQHKYYTIEGETKRIGEWSKEYGIQNSTIIKRIEEGKTTKEEIFKKRKIIYAEFFGEKKTLKELSILSGLKIDTIRYRHNKGLKDNDLIKPPKQSQ